jgi:hypothetical protein
MAKKIEQGKPRGGDRQNVVSGARTNTKLAYTAVTGIPGDKIHPKSLMSLTQQMVHAFIFFRCMAYAAAGALGINDVMKIVYEVVMDNRDDDGNWQHDNETLEDLCERLPFLKKSFGAYALFALLSKAKTDYATWQKGHTGSAEEDFANGKMIIVFR